MIEDLHMQGTLYIINLRFLIYDTGTEISEDLCKTIGSVEVGQAYKTLV